MIHNRTSIGNLYFETFESIPVAHVAGLSLHVCGDLFNLADADVASEEDWTWRRAGRFNWSTGITVSVALSERVSTNAWLSALELEGSAGTAVALSPAFFIIDRAYTASVANAVSRVTVRPDTQHANATVAYFDGAGTALADADPATDGHQVDLDAGANVIEVRVTASDGVTMRTYTVTVTRAAQMSDDATLATLALSAGGLMPSFAPDVTEYTARVRNTWSRITVTALANDSAATVAFLDGEDEALADADPDVPGQQVDLEAGADAANTVKVVVTAQDATTNTYTVVVTRVAQGNANANLIRLEIERTDGTPIALSPSFSGTVTDYTMRVPNSVELVNMRARPSDSAAVVQVQC